MDQPVITCKNCGNRFSGKFCNNCGEKVYTEKDRHITHFIEEGFHFITHFEGKFFTTLRTLFTKPGQVSLDYTAGIRKKYFKLLSLFLLLIIVYLLFPAFEGLNMRLYYHVRHDLYGTYAMEKVLALMKERNLTDEAVTELFQKKSATVSKTMLLLIIPITAILFWAATFRRRKYFFDQMVFSTEVNSMFLLWGFLLLPCILRLIQWILKLLGMMPIWLTESLTGIMISLPLCVFTGIAAKRFYHLKVWQSVLFGIMFVAINFLVIQYIYKFILFVSVINTI